MADSKLLREQAKRLQAQADVMDAEAFYAALPRLKAAIEVINHVANLSGGVSIGRYCEDVGEELRQIRARLDEIADSAERIARRAAA